MQNKGAIRLLAILFAIVSLYQLSFSIFTSRVQSKAVEYSQDERYEIEAKALAERFGRSEGYYLDSLQKTAEAYYLDSMSNEVIYNLGIIDFTYNDCKEREINLGLDLKGGMNVTLEVQIQDVVNAMAGTNKNLPEFQKAINDAIEQQKNSQADFITIFYEVFKRENPNALLRTYFRTQELKEQISPDATDEEVLKVLNDQAEAAIGNTYDVLSKRIDQFGVSQPRIQRLQTAGRILVELPGVKDPKRVRKILQSTARLEFWETYSVKDPDIFNNLNKADEISYKYYKGVSVDEPETETTDSVATESNILGEETATSELETPADTAKVEENLLAAASDTTGKTGELESDSLKDDRTTPRLLRYLQPNYVVNGQMASPGQGPVIGWVSIRDTARVNSILKIPQVRNVFPKGVRFMWGVKPPKDAQGIVELFAIKVTNRDGQPRLDGEAITDARQDFDQNGRVEVTMSMNSQGALVWKNLTRDNIDQAIAIVLDGFVYSAPNVQSEIAGGNSQISGNFTIQEGEDLANVLKSGKLPVPARIIEEAVVGPSLGSEAVNAGLLSFIGAFILVLIYMILFYGKAGIIADIALVANMFFLFGVLASLQAVLTLPGIAGIVLTLGMAVDANVIIYERIKEEIRSGKGLKLAITEGYKNAYSAIIDGNITTFLTGLVLYIFGSGPVQGFATTLMIGIVTSLFSAIFISRLIINRIVEKNNSIEFDTKISRNFLTNVKVDFIGMRKKAYIISGSVIVIGLIFLFSKGLNPGIDFSGGRTYIVRFDQKVNTVEVAKKLSEQLVDKDGNKYTPEVKTFGPQTQIKITTRYLIENKDKEADSIVDSRIYLGTQSFFVNPISADEFIMAGDEKDRGILSSQKVDPTISDDLMWESSLAIFFALLIIFAYVASRFRRWQFGTGGIVALIHDALIVVSLYSIFTGILPFDMEVDQAFIAAILTIIGYSINDTVIIFDRIRENINLYPKRRLYDNMNTSINSTLARTLNTAGTTLVVLITIFIFGGEVIRGFIFALLVGITVGTYSSIFVASPIAYETMKMKENTDLEPAKKK